MRQYFCDKCGVKINANDVKVVVLKSSANPERHFCKQHYDSFLRYFDEFMNDVSEAKPIETNGLKYVISNPKIADKVRACIICYYYLGISYMGVADELDMNSGTVGGYLTKYKHDTLEDRYSKPYPWDKDIVTKVFETYIEDKTLTGTVKKMSNIIDAELVEEILFYFTGICNN